MKQVLDIEQMQHLCELSLDISKASMCWLKMNDVVRLSVHDEYCYESSSMEAMPAFTLQDILEMLPYKIVANYLHFGKKSFSGDILFYIEYSNFGGCSIVDFKSENFIDSAYNMLCWCIENGYLEDKK